MDRVTGDRSFLHDVGEIFRTFQAKGGMFERPLDREQMRVFRALSICRTAELGGHIDSCSECGEIRISYNSCRNRHCPKCQHMKREKWILDRERDLLPVKYHHMVFTVPAQLNILFLQNKRILYNALFRSVSETILEVADREKFLGAKPGIISILHTWGQKLVYHPHIHCIVTGGGLNGEKWIEKDSNFFLSVRVLSRLFRGKFLATIKRLHKDGSLHVTGLANECPGRTDFSRFLQDLYRKEWVVFCKEPFENPDHLIQYLGRYTHRIAISNHRILDTDEQTVSFSYKDYSSNSVRRVIKLSKVEFIRRFLLHVLPGGFVKIRYYGILANPVRRIKIARVRHALKNRLQKFKKSVPVLKTWKDLLLHITGLDPDLCPQCMTGKMLLALPLHASCRPP